jgi:hypothetical protein
MFTARNVAYFRGLDATMQTDRKQPTRTPIKEKKMFTKRLFNVLVVLILGIVVFFTLRVATDAPTPDQLSLPNNPLKKAQVSDTSANPQSDLSHEMNLAQQSEHSLVLAGSSYDLVENLSNQRRTNRADGPGLVEGQFPYKAANPLSDHSSDIIEDQALERVFRRHLSRQIKVIPQ